MKKFLYLFAFVALLFNSCIENEDILWEKSLVEWDAAAYNSRSVVSGVAKDYTLLTRRPAYGKAVQTSATASFAADPIINRTFATTNNGPVTLRVNLVGPHKSEAQTIPFRVVQTETTAVEGVHYGPLTGTVSIPANSSFGYVDITILNPGPPTPPPVGTPAPQIRLVLELVGNEAVAPSPKYDRIGIVIAQ